MSSLERYPNCPAHYRSAPTPDIVEFHVNFLRTEPPAETLLNPAEIDEYQPHVQDNSHVFRGLREVTNPIARVATRHIFDTLSSMEVSKPEIYTLPYEINEGLLFQTDFGKELFASSDGKLLNQAPKDASPQAKAALVEQYLRHSEHPEAYKATHEAYKARDAEDDFIGLCEYRIRTSKHHMSGLEVFTGRFSEFVVTKPDLGPAETGLPEALIMPIGEYGEAFARKLLMATRATMESFNRSTEADTVAAQTASQHQKLLIEHTARGAYEYATSGEVTGDSVKAALLEGTLSVMQVLAWLTAEKVPGYENPDDLVNDIIDQGLIEKLTRKITMATIGPTVVKGFYPKQPLMVANEKLDLSENLVKILAERKEAAEPLALEGLVARYNHKQWSGGEDKAEIYAAGRFATTGIICPAAGKDGGVRQAANALKAVYVQLD